MEDEQRKKRMMSGMICIECGLRISQTSYRKHIHGKFNFDKQDEQTNNNKTNE